MSGLDLSELELGHATGFCEAVHEPSGSIKISEISRAVQRLLDSQEGSHPGFFLPMLA